MTLPHWIIPILMAAASPAANSPAAATVVADTPQPVKLEFPLAGYRINAFASATKDFVFTIFLPVSKDGYFFRLEILSQTSKKGGASLQGEVKESKSYYKQAGYTIVSERTPSPAEWQVEFITKADRAGRGPNDHVYMRTLFANGRSYDIIATARDTQWAALGAKFKASVDSFEPSPEPVPGKVSFPQQGFRISLLDGVAPGDARGVLLMMPYDRDGPAEVTVEPYAKTLREYQAERKPPTMAGSKSKFTILAESSPAENALVTEYAEEYPADKKHPQGGQLLSYEKVFIAHGQLYRAWAFLFEIDPKSAVQTKAWVDSLEEMPAPAPAPTSVPASTPAKYLGLGA